MPQPVADQSVRVAWAADAEAIARVQVRAWRTTYAGVLPADALAELDEAAFAAQWRRSLAHPPDARHRVLVALQGQTVVGFAATGPSHDPDADPVSDGAVETFHVDPDAEGEGHGSRLLNACVDTLRADGFSRAVTWVFTQDDRWRAFLRDAGWAADTAIRELAVDDAQADEPDARRGQVRLHCALGDAPGG